MTDQIFFTDVTTAAATDFFVTYLIMKHSFEFHALLNCVAENWLLFDAYQTIINFKELGRSLCPVFTHGWGKQRSL